MQHAADAEANIIVGQVINPEIGDDLIVTVIADGVRTGGATGCSADHRRTPRRTDANGRPAQQVLTGVHAAASDRPIKDIDRPTFLRRLGETREAVERIAVVGDDEWDVPTFPGSRPTRLSPIDELVRVERTMASEMITVPSFATDADGVEHFSGPGCPAYQ